LIEFESSHSVKDANPVESPKNVTRVESLTRVMVSLVIGSAASVDFFTDMLRRVESPSIILKSRTISVLRFAPLPFAR